MGSCGLSLLGWPSPAGMIVAFCHFLPEHPGWGCTSTGKEGLRVDVRRHSPLSPALKTGLGELCASGVTSITPISESGDLADGLHLAL